MSVHGTDLPEIPPPWYIDLFAGASGRRAAPLIGRCLNWRSQMMQTIELTMEEVEALREMLKHKINEVDVEMFRTDTHDFKQMLKHRLELMEHILAKVTGNPIAV
jgi:hypothetical protein